MSRTEGKLNMRLTSKSGYIMKYIGIHVLTILLVITSFCLQAEVKGVRHVHGASEPFFKDALHFNDGSSMMDLVPQYSDEVDLIRAVKNNDLTGLSTENAICAKKIIKFNQTITHLDKFKKIIAIYRYLVKLADYPRDYTYLYHQYHYSAFLEPNITVCNGINRAFGIMCSIQGITTQQVVDTRQRHTYSLVLVPDTNLWTICDPTQDLNWNSLDWCFRPYSGLKNTIFELPNDLDNLCKQFVTFSFNCVQRYTVKIKLKYKKKTLRVKYRYVSRAYDRLPYSVKIKSYKFRYKNRYYKSKAKDISASKNKTVIIQVKKIKKGKKHGK
jgi:hypothetical protein